MRTNRISVLLLLVSVLAVAVSVSGSASDDCDVCISVVSAFSDSGFRCRDYSLSLLKRQKCGKLKQFLRDNARVIWTLFGPTETRDVAAGKALAVKSMCQDSKKAAGQDSTGLRRLVREITSDEKMCKELVEWLPRWEGACDLETSSFTEQCFEYERALVHMGLSDLGTPDERDPVQICNRPDVKEKLGMGDEECALKTIENIGSAAKENVQARLKAQAKRQTDAEVWDSLKRNVYIAVQNIDIMKLKAKTLVESATQDFLDIKNDLKPFIAIVQQSMRANVLQSTDNPIDYSYELVDSTGELLLEILNEMMRVVGGSLGVVDKTQPMKAMDEKVRNEGEEVYAQFGPIEADTAGFSKARGVTKEESRLELERRLDSIQSAMSQYTSEPYKKSWEHLNASLRMVGVYEIVRSYSRKVAPILFGVFGKTNLDSDPEDVNEKPLPEEFDSVTYIKNIVARRNEYGSRLRELINEIDAEAGGDVKGTDAKRKWKKTKKWAGLSDTLQSKLDDFMNDMKQDAHITREMHRRYHKYKNRCAMVRAALLTLKTFQPEKRDEGESDSIAGSTFEFMTEAIGSITNVMTTNENLFQCKAIDTVEVVMNGVANMYESILNAIDITVDAIRPSKELFGWLRTGSSPQRQLWTGESAEVTAGVKSLLESYAANLEETPKEVPIALMYTRNVLQQKDTDASRAFAAACQNVNTMAYRWGEMVARVLGDDLDGLEKVMVEMHRAAIKMQEEVRVLTNGIPDQQW